jgi:hypothetical protein
VECENYTSLKEKGDKYHDINGENYLLFTPTKGDMEESSSISQTIHLFITIPK